MRRLFAPLFLGLSLLLGLPWQVSAQAPLDFSQIVRESLPAVVSLQVRYPAQGGEGFDPFFSRPEELFENFFGFLPKREQAKPSARYAQASGFLISAEGLILTNSHVVEGMDQIQVTLRDGRHFLATLLGKDPDTDVAVIQIPANNLPFLEFGDSSQVLVGQWILAIGSPLGLNASVTHGIISATERNDLAVAVREDFLQTDAPINRGNSGGPLIDMKGKVIGMATAKVDSWGARGLGFAIPSHLLKAIRDEILATGTVIRGYLGVSLQAIDYDLAQLLKIDKVQGALVTEVQPNSPAQKGGLQAGDLIVKLNGETATNLGWLRNRIALARPGTPLEIELWRDGQIKQVTAVAEAYPTAQLAIPQFAGKNLLGLQVAAAGSPGEEGVVITSVEPQSVAALAGLKKGGHILEINRKKIASPAQFDELVASIQPGERTLLLVRQERVTRFLALVVR